VPKVRFQPKTTKLLHKQTKSIQNVRKRRRDKRYISIFKTISKSHEKTQIKISQEAVHKIWYKKSFQIK